MSIEKKHFGFFGGKEVFSYTMTNAGGASVTVLSYGGILNRLLVPDRNGVLADVLCGFDTVEGYVADRKSYSCSIVGRCGNRISGGGFDLNGQRVYVAPNEGRGIHLHGGWVGFNRRLWDVTELPGTGSDSLLLTLFSPDMEEGYPGNLFVRVRYTFDDENALTINYEADTDRDTYINLTNHAYFNLNGYDGRSAMEQELMINADYYDEVDEFLYPTAKTPVDGTIFDFRRMKKIGVTYDHSFHINGKADEFRFAGAAYDDESGRYMEFFTDLPAVQLYTAGGMNGETLFKGGVPQRLYHAFCLETQNPPDLPNRPDLEQRFTKAGGTYRTTTKYVFGTK